MLYPLSKFYSEAGLRLPAVRRVEPPQIPEPYRRLLVHEQGMTPTLEAAYGQRVHLHVMKYTFRENALARQVLLVLEDKSTVAGLGASEINLDPFPEEARRLILERRKPLGTILRLQEIEHVSRPEAYFRVTPDASIGEALGVDGTAGLYGRRNVLRSPSGQVLAQVVEILPPSNPFSNGRTGGG